MSKVLYIKANPKPEGTSRTFKLSDAFIEAYRKHNPNDEIITLDLYKEDIGFLSAEDVAFNNFESEEARNHPVFKYSYQFLESDKIIIAAPFWNLSYPAILKAYLDYIAVGGITFGYTSEGPVGLCQGKKVMHIVTRGGEYSEKPLSEFELGDRYLRTLFGFLGIKNFATYAVENMDRSSTNVEAVLDEAIEELEIMAKAF